MYSAPGQQPNLLMMLLLLLVGMGAGLGWVWSAFPDTIGPLSRGLTASDYVLLIAFLIVGLIAATLIGSLAQAFVRMALVCMQFALLILVVWAGVIAWRHYNASSNNGRLSGAALTAEEPGGDLPLRTSEGPQERRQRLEEELFQLDAESGHAWWDVDAAPASDP